MEVVVLSRKDLESVLNMPEVIKGVAAVYKEKSAGNTVVWPLVEHHFNELNAVMDIRSGGVFGNINLHGLKMLNNFPLNAKEGLPAFTGLLMVCDSTTGLPLGIMDASFITSMRTGAAGAIGAKSLARKDAKTLMMLGAGRQSIFQIAATLTLIPSIEKVIVTDPLSFDNAVSFAENCAGRLNKEFGIEAKDVSFQAIENIQNAVGESDIIITITPARTPAIKKEWIKPGTHLSCVGADMVGKEEIDPQIFADARFFGDDINQCLRVGEMEIPFKTGIIKEDDVAGEIGQVLAGAVEGRTSQDEITIFDATGLALLDLITAKTAIALAKEKGIGAIIEF